MKQSIGSEKLDGRIRRIGTGPSVLLLLSALLGIAILVTDQDLWEFQPIHGYGLILFTVIDSVLLLLVAFRTGKSSLRVSAVWGGVQVSIMTGGWIGDIATPNPSSASHISPSDFAIYLFGLGHYDNRHFAILLPLLFSVLLALAVVAYRDSQRASTFVHSS